MFHMAALLVTLAIQLSVVERVYKGGNQPRLTLPSKTLRTCVEMVGYLAKNLSISVPCYT